MIVNSRCFWGAGVLLAAGCAATPSRSPAPGPVAPLAPPAGLVTEMSAPPAAAVAPRESTGPTTSVSTPTNAPVNEPSPHHVVRYFNVGPAATVQSRREDAYHQMHNFCRGPYRIDAEGPRAEGGVVFPLPLGVRVGVPLEFWYIQFSCVR